MALWCRGWPRWYQEWFLSEIGLEHLSAHAVHAAAAREVAAKFAERLREKHRRVLFLMKDAAVLAKCFSEVGGIAVACEFTRGSFAPPRRLGYLELFDVVNMAVNATSAQGYGELHRHYVLQFDAYARRARRLPGALLRVAERAARQHVDAIADTGLQGTFAFAISAVIERLTGQRKPVHIAVAYPWLANCVQASTQSFDARVLLALEHWRAPIEPS